MRVLLISDTHRSHQPLKTVIEKVEPDKIYHMGDGEGDEDYIRKICSCPLEIVRGNCDYYSNLPADVIFTVGRHVVMMTHGHLYNVNMGTETLEDAARLKGADVVWFGHTHCPQITYHKDLTVVNPGSLCFPRQGGLQKSFVVMDVDRSGDLHFALNYLDE